MLPKNNVVVELKDGRMMRTCGRIDGDYDNFLACPVDCTDPSSDLHIIAVSYLHPKYFR
jgi:hypothetical protein